ncbi:MAG: HesA/MoeB/ThiF family protein [Chitinophagaceae bacterium]
MSNSDTRYERYARQLSLKEFGEAGQERLLQSSVIIVGAGGLGCAILPYLAAAGVGRIGIIDDDVIKLHNLHRQVLYTVNDIGFSKAKQAAAALKKINPEISIEAFKERLLPVNALSLLNNFDLIIDGTDNFASRYMINDACVLLNKPFVYGAVSKFEGQVAVFNYRQEGVPSVNYRDLFPQPPQPGSVDNCEEAGVLGVLPGIIGTMMANEAIKLLAGIGQPLVNRLLTYNAFNNQMLELELQAQQGTRQLIPENETVFAQTDYEWLCGTNTLVNEIDAETFDRLKGNDKVLVADVRELGELPLVTEFAHVQSPLSKLTTDFPLADNIETIILFCQSGKRSRQAAQVLTDKFGDNKKIYSLANGIVSWKQSHKN